MVIPIGGDPLAVGPDTEAPQVIKEFYYIFWWACSGLLAANAVGRMLAKDLIGGFNIGILSLLAYYLVKNGCAKMSQCCVLYFGVISSLNGCLEGLTLMSCISGRETYVSTSNQLPTGDRVYTIVVQKHPFYEPSQGYLYNLQSAMMLITPVMMILSAMLAVVTYQKFPDRLFEVDEDEGPAENRGLGFSAPPNYPSYGSGAHQDPGDQRDGTRFSAFEGRGHRLHDV
mmetsp:Transcript_60927/g.132162  ORF Transcript_60927/g.132162 Transcript_60927/m.132162 type:complete len:228 (+) Transcript_60927:73-756(+)